MFNFIKEYLNKLRHSDEGTKHRSAMTMAIIFSIIILSIAFTLLKNKLFNFSNFRNIDNITQSESDKNNNVSSPIDSIKSFFNQTGKAFSGIKNTINSAKDSISY